MNRLNRRSFLGLTAGLAGAAALSACGGGSSASPAGAPKDLLLPDSVTPPALPGQLSSTVGGVLPAYTQYPASPKPSVSAPPGSGGDITTMQVNYNAPPPALSGNIWQQELNKQLNANIKATLVTDADLAQKTQTFIASGDIPDIFYLNLQPNKAPAALGAVLQGAFIELSPYLGGSHSKDYPNLAALPAVSWKNSAIQGGLYGVPRPVPAANTGQPLFRADWMQRLGGKAPTNADEVYAMLKAFSTNKTWAFGAVTPWDQEFVLSMFGVPNNWRLNSDGTLTSYIETDEFEAALEFLVKLWKDGGFHPNAASNNYSQEQDLWTGGSTGFFGGNMLASLTYLRGTPIKGVADMVGSIKPFIAPGKDGGAAGFYQGPASYGMFSIPSTHAKDEKKVRELLSVLNYFAAPFGSAEYTLINYGVEGHNYTMKDGIPTPSQNPAMLAEMAGQYVPSPIEASIYDPGPPNESATIQKYFEQVTPSLVPDPTMTKVSQTRVAKGATLDKLIQDEFKAIVSGQKPLSELDTLRKNWKAQGGDAVRREFQDSK
ncbi:extracellular solute-binding protein [Rugosimonospora acidiphila]|uniref:Extracellular solute-binding protein n=1 Tax=Rugosimonospora acidiphila TaxID=556531 RepID=A0ABP9RWQ5_9ACTN